MCRVNCSQQNILVFVGVLMQMGCCAGVPIYNLWKYICLSLITAEQWLTLELILCISRPVAYSRNYVFIL